MSERFFHVTMTVLALAFLGVSTFGLYATHIAIIPSQYAAKILIQCLLLLGAFFYRWRKAEKAVNLIMITFWTILFGLLYQFPMFIACRSQVPMSDSLLASADRAMGIEVPQVLQAMAPYPQLNRSLTTCYNLLLGLTGVAIIVPPLSGKMRQAKEYVFAGVVSALIALPLFAAFQALGPWVYYGYTPSIDQTKYMETFYRLKTDTIFVLDINYSDGLICFPSFHTVLAILAAKVLWSVPYVRLPAAVLASLIIVSTVTTGSHYLVDVIAGIGVALLSILAAKAYTRAETRRYHTSLSCTATDARRA